MDQAKVKELKTQHGKCLVVDFDGKELAFKKFTKVQLQELMKNVQKKPELALELSINACSFACVHGQEHLTQLTEEYPLAFGGSDDEPGVCEQLIKMSRGSAKFTQV